MTICSKPAERRRANLSTYWKGVADRAPGRKICKICVICVSPREVPPASRRQTGLQARGFQRLASDAGHASVQTIRLSVAPAETQLWTALSSNQRAFQQSPSRRAFSRGSHNSPAAAASSTRRRSSPWGMRRCRRRRCRATRPRPGAGDAQGLHRLHRKRTARFCPLHFASHFGNK